jgi:hypothetical protein
MVELQNLAPHRQPTQLAHGFISDQSAPHNESHSQGMSGSALRQYLRQLLHGNRQCFALMRDITMQHRSIGLRIKFSITLGAHLHTR